MLKNFDIEEFYDYHNITLQWNYFDSYARLKISLELNNEIIGECTLHGVNKKKITEEDLFWFFDEIESVASDNFHDITQYNLDVLNRMKSKRFMYLTNLYINEKYRNIGLGSIFLEEIEDMIKFMSIKDIYLVSAMYKDNKEPYRNESFYLKNGYKIINDSKDFHDGKMMYKQIK